jgi:hypothetical protein
MANSQGFKRVLRPWLEDKINHTWLDPREARDNEDFKRRYELAWALAQSADQILKFVDDEVAHAIHLEKKEAGKGEAPIRIGE